METNLRTIIYRKDDDENRLVTNLSDPQIKIRITPFIKNNIAFAAKKNARSKSAEILYRLKKSFENESSENKK